MTGMFTHIVLYKLKEPTEENKKALQEKFLSMIGKVEPIRNLETGIDCLQLDRSFDVSLHVKFDSKEDFFVYKDHPFHKGVAEYVHSVVERSVSVDFE